MTIYARLIAVGTIDSGATTISADVSGQPTAAGQAPFDLAAITLSADYAMAGPAEFPSRPPFTGVDTAHLQYPRTIPSGTTYQTFACEAAALVTAGAASYYA